MADDQNPELPLPPPPPGDGSPGALNIQPVNIEEEMKKSYLDYSMSVIIGRALPDVRDGLKPVHRRILYAMHDMGLLHNRKHSKCAGVVGELLKKYHVKLALGSDSYRRDTLPEALYIESLHVFDHSALLTMWCTTTANTIFPKRLIGSLKEGYEASFLVLKENPLENFSAVQQITMRVKQGRILNSNQAR